METVPIEAVRLEADVMTPHYAGWSADEPPGDWMPPAPIPLRQDALKNPAGRWRLDLDGNTEAEVLDKVRVHLEKERLADSAERRAFAEAVLAACSEWVTQ